MQPKLLAALAAMILVPSSVLLAAETSKAPEAKTPAPAMTEQPKMVTYLGVEAVPAGRALERHLGLPDGFGLLVEAVAPDSPAAKAGIAPYDVLQKLDDQLLVDLHQLRELVWMHKSGDAIKIAYYRNGKPETASLTLGSTDLKTEKEAFSHGLGQAMEKDFPWFFWHPRMSEFGGKMPMMGMHGQCCMNGTGGAKSAVSGTSQAKAPEGKATAPEGKAAPKAETSANVNITTDKYSVTVSEKGGQEFATVKTTDGKEICKDLPQAKWNTLPEDVRSILGGVQIHVKGASEQVKIEA